MSSSPSGSTSILSPAMEQTAGLTPTRTLPPDSAPVSPEPARTSIPAEASTTVPTAKPATPPPSQPSAVEAALTEEVTIDLDEVDHFIEQPSLIQEAPGRDSVAVGDLLLDRYRLVALIGEGGMSRVFKATESAAKTPASPDSFMGVKVLTRPINEDYGSFESFRKEVQKLRGLTHPNIVRIFDCDRDDSIVFITMEYLAGPSLYSKLHGGAAAGKTPSGLGRDEAQYIVLAIADALDYAHRNGVVHGDLKPGNVIVLNRGEIKVIDFDMARWVARPETGLERREASQPKSSPAVTPSYASPQLMARQEPEPAQDVYALACLACGLPTGKPPFEAGGAGRGCTTAGGGEPVVPDVCRHDGVARGSIQTGFGS